MTYTLKDVETAVKQIKAARPQTIISRSDYDFALAVRDKDSKQAIILFRPERENQSEISSTPDEIETVLFFLGQQWTEDQIKKMKSALPRWVAPINKISSSQP